MTDLAPPPRWDNEQWDYLTQAINPNRIRVSEDEEAFAYLQIWDIKRQLLRVFRIGGFDAYVRSALLEKIRVAPAPTRPTDRTAWTVMYEAHVRLVVKDFEGRSATLEGEGFGDADRYPFLAAAYRAAKAKALAAAWKHAAMLLGDQFGLSLYNNGSGQPVVRDFAVRPEGWDPDNPDPRVLALIASDEPVAPELTYDRLVSRDRELLDVAEDVQTFFADSEGWTTADIEAKIDEAFRLGISERHAGATEEGRPLTVDDLILVIGMRRMRERDQANQAAPALPADDDTPPACSCDPADLATTGEHAAACVRGRSLIAALDDALPR